MKKYLLLFSIFLVLSCSSDDNGSENIEASLTVNVDFTNYNSAIISWQFTGNTSDVVYEIVLNGEEVADDYSGTQYEFTQLNQNSDYTGKVFAKQQNGTITFAEFTFRTGFLHFHINNQVQIDNFNYTTIGGKLTISGQDVYDLSGLSELTSVGSIAISNTNITNLNGLQNIQVLTLGLFSSYQNQLLEDVSALSNISADIKNLYIIQNDLLTDLTGLNISDNAEELTINSTPIDNLNVFSNIKNIKKISLVNLPNLNSVEGLISLETIEQNLDLENLPSLTSLVGFNNLTSISFDLTLNDLNIVNFQGFNGLTSTKRLFFYNLNSLQSLSGFDNLEVINGGFTITECDNLEDLGDFQSLTTISPYLSLSSLPSLTSISGLSNLNSVDSFFIGECPNLLSLDGLNNLTTISGFTLRNLNSITNLTPLSNLTINTYELFDEILIENLINLTSLEALSNVEKINLLTLINLPNISSLEGLNGLTKVNTLNLENINVNDLNGLNNLSNVHEIVIDNCDLLQNLSGSGIINDDEAFNQYFSKINIKNCSILTDFCGLTDYANNTPYLYVTCSGNQYNPTKTQLRSTTECSQ